MHFIPLVPFSPLPTTSLYIEAAVSRAHSTLQFTFVLRGDLAALGLSAPSMQRERRDELWRATCFEAFFGIAGELGYWELNVAPNGDWNVYHFTDYRVGMTWEQGVENLEFFSELASPECFTVRVALNLAKLLAGREAAPLQLGLTTVLAHPQAGTSYWALTHCGETPDFHRRESFVLLPLSLS